MKKTIGILALSIALFSCSDSEENARLEIRLTDAPGDYEAVYVDIQGVEIHADEGNTSNGWKSLEVQEGRYNLLEFTNGIDTLLATAVLPAGRISQIRLILGDNNSVKIDGQEIGVDDAERAAFRAKAERARRAYRGDYLQDLTGL